jgi:DNA replication initiation complex subunit (GINS family)
VQFNEEEFYNPSLPNQKIRVYEETNLSQSINTLGNEEATRILDDIDVTHQEMQQDLGGKGTSESTTTTEVDHATPSQTSDSPHIQLTSDINELYNQQDNNDEILGDQPITPPLDPKSDDTDNSDETPFPLF